jgi:hypothetical protein
MTFEALLAVKRSSQHRIKQGNSNAWVAPTEAAWFASQSRFAGMQRVLHEGPTSPLRE